MSQEFNLRITKCLNGWIVQNMTNHEEIIIAKEDDELAGVIAATLVAERMSPKPDYRVQPSATSGAYSQVMIDKMAAAQNALANNVGWATNTMGIGMGGASGSQSQYANQMSQLSKI